MNIKVLLSTIFFILGVNCLTFSKNSMALHTALDFTPNSGLSPKAFAKFLSRIVSDDDLMANINQGDGPNEQQVQALKTFMVQDPLISKEILQKFTDKTGYSWVNNLKDETKQKIVTSIISGQSSSDGDYTSVVDALQEDPDFKEALEQNQPQEPEINENQDEEANDSKNEEQNDQTDTQDSRNESNENKNSQAVANDSGEGDSQSEEGQNEDKDEESENSSTSQNNSTDSDGEESSNIDEQTDQTDQTEQATNSTETQSAQQSETQTDKSEENDQSVTKDTENDQIDQISNLEQQNNANGQGKERENEEEDTENLKDNQQNVLLSA